MRPNNLLLLVLLLFCAGVSAQMEVRIVDANGRGIPGVALLSPDGEGVVTDASGQAVLKSVEATAGEWTLRCLGFVERTLQGDVLLAGKDIRLEEAVLDLPQALVEAVSLTAGRPMGVPGAVTVLSAKTLQRHGDVDVNRALRSVPGVYIQEEDGFGLRPNIGLRGSGSERSSRIPLFVFCRSIALSLAWPISDPVDLKATAPAPTITVPAVNAIKASVIPKP